MQNTTGRTLSAQTAVCWKRTDIVLTSTADYANPYTDVSLDAIFTHEDGTEIALYGFWNGGKEFRVRFAPTKEGIWTYRTKCSDSTNIGLHDCTGTIFAEKNTGKTELDRHGFIRISDNGRYFVHDDGTPFFWLGDTQWQAPNYVSLHRCNYPGCSCGNQFQHELNDRLSKGFTVYQTYFDIAESDGGGQRDTTPEPGLWLARHTMINPAVFTEKIDFMFDCLADAGMVIALGYGVHSSTVNSMSPAAMEQVSRYLTARYAAYPVVWITAQEITGEPQFRPWVRSAEITAAGDGYHHPQGAHQFPIPADSPYVTALNQTEWHSFFALQAGHGPSWPKKSLYEGYWNNSSGKTKPYFETEANYEDISCGNFNGYAASRIAAWRANLLGSYGFTYGVTGIWANCYSTAGDTGWMGSYSYEPWYMGLDKPGSREMTYLARFFRYADFSALVPRFNDPAWSDCTDETKLVSSSDDRRTYAAYFCNTDLSTGKLKGLLTDTAYSAKWYDPLTGKFKEITSSFVPEQGEYTVPQKPSAGDWALLVTSRSDLGEYRTETVIPVPDEKFTEHGTPQKPDVTCSGSFIYTEDGIGTNTTDALFDGNPYTEWVPFSPICTQTISMDLGRSKPLCGIRIIPGKGSVIPPYRIMGSDDGEDWDILADSAAENTCMAAENVLTGSYRYVQLLWFGTQSRTAAKNIGAITLFAM